MIDNFKKTNNGQALMILVIAAAVSGIVLFGIFLISNATLISVSKVDDSRLVYAYAESGIEEGILRLLRDETFSATTFSLNGSSVNIGVAGSGPYVITSTATLNNFVKRAQASIGIGDSVVINYWNEIP